MRQVWPHQMRVKIAGEIGKQWPRLAWLITEYLARICDEQGRAHAHFQVGGIPRSLNHMYERSLQFCEKGTPGAFQDKGGRWRVQSSRLKPEALAWRLAAIDAMGDIGAAWKPKGQTAAVLLFESPYWLDSRRRIREKDVDNLIKPTLDAIQQATQIPDETIWSAHAFKVLSKRQRTNIFLFELGDVVEYFY